MVMSTHLAVVLISNNTCLSNNRLNSIFVVHIGCACCPIDTHIFRAHSTRVLLHTAWTLCAFPREQEQGSGPHHVNDGSQNDGSVSSHLACD